jgi:hypothetical protein
MTKESTQADERVVRALAEAICVRVVRSVIRSMRQFPAGNLADEGLDTVWEEFCVQIQGIETVIWPVYERFAMEFLYPLAEGLADYERTAVWLQTQRADDWRIDYEFQEPDDPVDDAPPVDLDEVADYLYAELCHAAGYYSNRRIRAALE